MWTRRIRESRRDRLTFSKSILKRYMRECVVRQGGTSAPWFVKPSIANQFGISPLETASANGGGEEDGKGKGKRRKAGGDEPTAKRKKTGEYSPTPLPLGFVNE
jgi:hypothetical protein